ncbi:MAG: 50S ribosomal protein L24 [Polyangia bacterium]
MDRVRKGDTVVVISGKEKGKRGKVLRVVKKTGRVVVERLQMVKRHTKPTQQNAQGGIIEKEGTIHLSNVMLLDPGSDKPTRMKIKNENGTRSRVGKSGTVIEASK